MRGRFSLAAVLGLFVLTACGSDRATGLQESFVGSYTLSKTDGQSLPWTITGFSCENSLRGGSLLVMSDFTLKGSLDYRYDCKTGGVSAPVTGSWAFTGTWSGPGGELILIHDTQASSRDFGPVLTNGTLFGSTLNLTVDLLDCKGTGQGPTCKTSTQAVLTFTK